MATHLSRLTSANAIDVVPLLKSISGTTFFGTFFDPPDRGDVVPLLKSISGTTFFGTFFDPPDRGDVEINIKLTPRRYFIKPGVDCELGPVDVCTG